MTIGIGGIVSLGGGSAGGAASGIQTLNPGNNIGPTVQINGVNGISVTSPSSNTILIDGAGLSGLIGNVSISGVSRNLVASYSASFSSLTSGIFSHNFNTRETIVQVYDNSLPPRVLFPDSIVSENLDQVSVLFNRPQTGRVVIHAPSGINLGSSSVNKFAQSFTNTTSVNINHNLGTDDVLVQIKDTNSPANIFIPDKILIVDSNNITVSFNSARSGKVIIIG